MTISFNGVKFKTEPGVSYRYDYEALLKNLRNLPVDKQISRLKWLVLNDTFFTLQFFVIRGHECNRPFVVQACREVETGPQDMTLDIWGREHFKTTICSVTRPIMKALSNPEWTHITISYANVLAKKITRQIKDILETQDQLIKLFPDVLYEEPERQSDKWGELTGLNVKRRSSPKETTFASGGLIDGMPTGDHYWRRQYDDIMTLDMADNPDSIQKAIDRYYYSENLGKDGGSQGIVGTPYAHNDVIMALKELKNPETGQPVFHVREKPSTVDGTFWGKPVLLSEKRINTLRLNKVAFATQHLLNPSEVGDRPLPRDLPVVPRSELPEDLMEFILVDPSGESRKKNYQPDKWGILLVGITPYTDHMGLVDLYILGGKVARLSRAEAISSIADIFMSRPYIRAVAVERVGLSSFENSIAKAIAARGRIISVEANSIRILEPKGRNKIGRIIENLSVPAWSKKIHFVDTCPDDVKIELRNELDKFPRWDDDGLDSLSYAYDLIKNMTLPLRADVYPNENDRVFRDYDEAATEENSNPLNWMLGGLGG